jgi:hypothetical protein
MNKGLLAAAVIAAGAATALPAFADDPGDVKGWHGSVTPYFWLTNMKGNLHNSPIADNLPPGTGDIDISFLDLLSHLGFGIMGAGDVRYNRIGVIGDFVYARVSADAPVTVGEVNLNAHTTVKTTLSTMGAYYRVYSGHAGSLDLVAGARVDNIKVGVNLSTLAGIGDGVSRGFSRTLVDPVFGLRGVARLTDRWSLTGYGDVGGVSGSTVYQVIGGVDYKLSRQWSTNLSLRYYVVDINAQDIDLGYHLSMFGPVIGATYKF